MVLHLVSGYTDVSRMLCIYIYIYILISLYSLFLTKFSADLEQIPVIRRVRVRWLT
jgi:hypothetical protein